MNQRPRLCSVCRVVGVLSALANGCALTSKADLVNIRYFNPEQPATNHVRPTGERSAAVLNPVSLRLGRVRSGQHLRERIVYQHSDYELGYHDDLRWLERPEVYAERAVSRALFERRSNRQVLTASAPTLEVEVSAFHEVRTSEGHYAYVRLEARVTEMNEVIWQNTIETRESVVGSKIEGVVVAMAMALEKAAEVLAQGASAALNARPNTDVLVREH